MAVLTFLNELSVFSFFISKENFDKMCPMRQFRSPQSLPSWLPWPLTEKLFGLLYLSPPCSQIGMMSSAVHKSIKSEMPLPCTPPHAGPNAVQVMLLLVVSFDLLFFRHSFIWLVTLLLCDCYTWT